MVGEFRAGRGHLPQTGLGQASTTCIFSRRARSSGGKALTPPSLFLWDPCCIFGPGVFFVILPKVRQEEYFFLSSPCFPCPDNISKVVWRLSQLIDPSGCDNIAVLLQLSLESAPNPRSCPEKQFSIFCLRSVYL